MSFSSKPYIMILVVATNHPVLTYLSIILLFFESATLGNASKKRKQTRPKSIYQNVDHQRCYSGPEALEYPSSAIGIEIDQDCVVINADQLDPQRCSRE